MYQEVRRERVTVRGNDVLVRTALSGQVIHHRQTAEGQSHPSLCTTQTDRHADMSRFKD